MSRAGESGIHLMPGKAHGLRERPRLLLFTRFSFAHEDNSF